MKTLEVRILIFQTCPSSCGCCRPAGRSARPVPSPEPPWGGGTSGPERWEAPQTSSPSPPLLPPPPAAAAAPPGPAGGAVWAAAEPGSPLRRRRKVQLHPAGGRTPPPGGGAGVGGGGGGRWERWRVDSQRSEGGGERAEPRPTTAHSASCPHSAAPWGATRQHSKICWRLGKPRHSSEDGVRMRRWADETTQQETQTCFYKRACMEDSVCLIKKK